MSDFLTYLEQDLVEAARRRAAGVTPLAARRRRPPFGSFLLAGLVALVVGGSAAAGTLIVLRGSVIPAPSSEDAGPSQTVEPKSSTVLPLRARDPGGGAPYALRLAKSRTGETCTTVGQVVDGTFGVVGLDGRFRELAAGAVDGCGSAGTTLVGARIFDAKRPADVRTVVNGVAGDRLRGVTIVTVTGNTTVRPGAGGTFVYALRGYPDQTALEVSLRFAGGRLENHSLGANPNLFVGAGEAWEPFPFVQGKSTDRCLSFDSLRPPIAQGPAECTTRAELRKRDGYSVAIRRIDASSRRWAKHAPITAAWGQASSDAVAVEAITPKGPVKGHFVPPKRNFVFVFPPSVDPETVSVRITFRDGRVVTATRDTHTVTPPAGSQ